MGFRGSLMTGSILVLVLSYFVGTWLAWPAVTLLFFAIILYFIDKE